MRARLGSALVGALLGLLCLAPAGASGATCPVRVDPGELASAATLRKLNSVMARIGPRPTGSPAHDRFVGWIERELRRFPGVRVSTEPYRIRRWTARRAELRATIGAGSVSLPLAGPVPYAAGTPAGGVTAPVAYIPPGTPITAANAAGRIVVRDLTTLRVPLGVFEALQWSRFDPGNTLDPNADYERNFLSYNERIEDLRAAAGAGAAGLLSVHDFPRSQVRGHYEPYEGLRWKVPALQLGVDEGQRLKDALAAGAPVTATLVLRTRVVADTTRNLLARIRGKDKRRIVIDSHSDGVNALWDNGTVSMIAMARYLADRPRRCRGRTVEFAFATAHLYQHLVSSRVREGGAEQLAERLDREYARGKVAAVLVLEHFGAREYAAVPRANAPGRTLRRTGRHEPTLIGVSDSDALVRAVQRRVERHDLRRHILLKGADGAVPERAPPNCSFGGEGTPFNRHLLPTVGAIAAPWILFNPPFGLESIDFRLMRRQTLAFTGLTLDLERMSARAIAGRVNEHRRRRSAGAETCES